MASRRSSWREPQSPGRRDASSCPAIRSHPARCAVPDVRCASGCASSFEAQALLPRLGCVCSLSDCPPFACVHSRKRDDALSQPDRTMPATRFARATSWLRVWWVRSLLRRTIRAAAPSLLRLGDTALSAHQHREPRWGEGRPCEARAMLDVPSWRAHRARQCHRSAPATLGHALHAWTRRARQVGVALLPGSPGARIRYCELGRESACVLRRAFEWRLRLLLARPVEAMARSLRPPVAQRPRSECLR